MTSPLTPFYLRLLMLFTVQMKTTFSLSTMRWKCAALHWKYRFYISMGRNWLKRVKLPGRPKTFSVCAEWIRVESAVSAFDVLHTNSWGQLTYYSSLGVDSHEKINNWLFLAPTGWHDVTKLLCFSINKSRTALPSILKNTHVTRSVCRKQFIVSTYQSSLHVARSTSDVGSRPIVVWQSTRKTKF